MSTLQIALARAYEYFATKITEYGGESEEAAQIIEEMVCIRYWYTGVDPATDPERRHIPPPPPPPPPPF